MTVFCFPGIDRESPEALALLKQLTTDLIVKCTVVQTHNETCYVNLVDATEADINAQVAALLPKPQPPSM